jgi:4a-hydroxytetrahydrobiopterin dehydratase
MTAPNHWSISGKTLSRTFITENFDSSFDLAFEIKEVADDLQHHPDILITFNTVVVTTSTHDTNSLTDKDYELAEAINEVYDTDDAEFDGYNDREEGVEEDDDDTDLDVGDEDIY